MSTVREQQVDFTSCGKDLLTKCPSASLVTSHMGSNLRSTIFFIQNKRNRKTQREPDTLAVQL